MDSLDNSKVVYSYLVGYKCCIRICLPGRRIYENDNYVGRKILDLPFQIRTKHDVFRAEEALKDQLIKDTNKNANSDIDNVMVISFQSIINQ